MLVNICIPSQNLPEHAQIIITYSNFHCKIFITACCDTGTGGPRAAKKLKVFNKYCEVCDLECTSDVVYEQHIKGIKHAKKMKNLEIMKITGTESQVKNPNESGGKKKAKRFALREGILECRDSVIGMLKESVLKISVGD